MLGTPGSPAKARKLGATLVAAIALTVVAIVGTAGAASALSSITVPSGFTCNTNRTVSIVPPRLYASGATTEQVMWYSQVERWNGSTWTIQTSLSTYGAFDKFGTNKTGWTTGYYANNRLTLPVGVSGYYRVAYVLGNSSLSQLGYVANGAYCWVP